MKSKREKKERIILIDGIHLLGRDRVVPTLCQCEQERLLREKQQEAEYQRMLQIQRLKANGIQDRHLLEWRFAVAEDSRDIQMARRYVEQWQRRRQREQER